MTIEHREIADSGRHEPKHGSSAVAGEVLSSLGNDQTGFRTLDVIHTDLLLGQDFTDQALTLAGQEMKVTLGVAQQSSGGEVSIDDTGLVTFLQAGTYFLRLTLRPKRIGTAGAASLMIKTELNGILVPPATRQITIDGEEAGSFSASFNLTAKANDTICAIAMYDVQPGSDNAGFYTYSQTSATVPAEWPDTPSAQVRISKVEVV